MTRKQVSLGFRVKPIAEPGHQNRNPYKVPMNIIPFRRARRPPILPAPSSSSLRIRIELYRLVYGAGMFVLGILAHMAWPKVWL
jgi:hypothetical protein